MFESNFDFGKFANFMGYFLEKLVAMVLQTKSWLEQASEDLKKLGD